MSHFFRYSHCSPKLTIALREARLWLVGHPGCTSAEFSEATHESITNLQSKGFATWKREDGVAKWYACEPKPKKPKGWEWRWNPDEMHWEHGDEVVETKWEEYRT